MQSISDQQRLDAQLKICALHRRRILWAQSKIQPYLPIRLDTYGQMDDVLVEHWDQLIWRFTKLQDLMGEKVFRTLLSRLQEPVVSAPFIDQLSRLEQLGILVHTEDWFELRQARNSSAHEYAESDEEGAQILNGIMEQVEKLLTILDRVEQMAAR